MGQLSILEMMAAPPARRDIAWLRNALQAAIELEFATLPPYLCAYWSIKNNLAFAALSIREILREEMLHFGLACNLLTSVGGSPIIDAADVVPKFPGSLPGGVRPELTLALSGLSPEALALFMAVESPDEAAEPGDGSTSIGEFYEAIQTAFDELNPQITIQGQLAGPFGLSPLRDKAEVERALTLIRTQGEGSPAGPEEGPNDLAHFFRFAEIYHGRKLVRDSNGSWTFSGTVIDFPEVWPMANIPTGGYSQNQVSPAIWNDVRTFDEKYTLMLNQLQEAWATGNGQPLMDSIVTMFSMRSNAVRLMQSAIPGSGGTYGPCFRRI